MIKKFVRKITTGINRLSQNVLKPLDDAPGSTVTFTLGDINPDVARALADAFRNVGAVEVIHGDLVKMDLDAIVSPANSFGDMSGGIDKAIDDAFEGELQGHVQEVIREQYLGELPVGTAIIIPTSGLNLPYVVVAPTMRVPGSIAGSINAYLAMRAVLANVTKFNATQPTPIRRVGIPGLGTGVGGLSADDSALQMRAAYDNVISGGWQRIRHASQAPFATR